MKGSTIKRNEKLITVRNLDAGKCRETAEMVAELERGSTTPQWPMRFRANGVKKAGQRE